MMAENSNIAWTHHTQNFWWGCDKVSKECRGCYIGPAMRRFGLEPFNGPMRTKHWSKPKKWNEQAKVTGERLRVFTCSMSDFFHTSADAWRDEAWAVIRDCPHLDWLILSKRIEDVPSRLPSDWGDGWPNVWLGVTVGVASSLLRLDKLAAIPAVVRFVSCEPLLERLDLRPWFHWIDWVISGGESGPDRHDTPVEWQRSLYNQCREYGVPFFEKQDTAFRPGQQGRIPDDLWNVKDFPNSPTMIRNPDAGCYVCGRSHKGQGGAFFGPACKRGERCCQNPPCPVCDRETSLVPDGVPAFECHYCKRLWPASFFGITQ